MLRSPLFCSLAVCAALVSFSVGCAGTSGDGPAVEPDPGPVTEPEESPSDLDTQACSDFEAASASAPAPVALSEAAGTVPALAIGDFSRFEIPASGTGSLSIAIPEEHNDWVLFFSEEVTATVEVGGSLISAFSDGANPGCSAALPTRVSFHGETIETYVVTISGDAGQRFYAAAMGRNSSHSPDGGEHIHDGGEHHHEDGGEHHHEDGGEHHHEDGGEHHHEDGGEHHHEDGGEHHDGGTHEHDAGEHHHEDGGEHHHEDGGEDHDGGTHEHDAGEHHDGGTHEHDAG